MAYDCYKTPSEGTWFDFRGAWNDYRGDDGYSILGGRDFYSYVTPEAEGFLLNERGLGSVSEAYYEDADALAAYLAEKNGEEYETRTLHGCVQGEWAIIVTPKRFEPTSRTSSRSSSTSATNGIACRRAGAWLTVCTASHTRSATRAKRSSSRTYAGTMSRCTIRARFSSGIEEGAWEGSDTTSADTSAAP